MLPLLFAWIWIGSDSIAGLSFRVSCVDKGPGFAVQVFLEKADRFGSLALYRVETPQAVRKLVSKVRVDRWALPKTYELYDGVKGQTGWSYEVVWEPATSAVRPSVLGTYWPYGQLPPPPRLHVEDAERGLLRCDFSEVGTYLMRGYNSFGEEVFTMSIEVAQKGPKRYQLPALPRGRYLVRIVEPTTAVSLAEVVISL